jgi:hypothetical protein
MEQLLRQFTAMLFVRRLIIGQIGLIRYRFVQRTGWVILWMHQLTSNFNRVFLYVCVYRVGAGSVHGAGR